MNLFGFIENDTPTKSFCIKTIMESMATYLEKEELIIITKDHEAKEEVVGKKITYKKLWKWLIEEGQ